MDVLSYHKKRSSRAWSARQEVSQDAHSVLEHAAKLDIQSRPSSMRSTGIICTIVNYASVEELTQLRVAGMNIMRLNFSHGTHAEHAARIANLRQSVTAEPLDGRIVGIALDTKGPEIRTGLVQMAALPENTVAPMLEAGQVVTITTDPKLSDQCSKELIFVDYPRLPQLMKRGQAIYIDDGLIKLTVKAVDRVKGELTCDVMNRGRLGSRKKVNLPAVSIDLPAVSEKDEADLAFGVRQGVDMVFASFVRTPDDVRAVRACLVAADPEVGKRIKIISKIENREGINNLDAILAVTDGVMVARGDLGIEIPAEKVFLAQKSMIAKCNLVGKPVICATQMLESMTTNPRPTRAEVSDVANAVLDGTDCVMLSAETATGEYPMEACQMMHSICVEAESAHFHRQRFADLAGAAASGDINESIAMGAVTQATIKQAVMIITLTSTGNSARLIAKYRPRCPIAVVTRHAHVGAACNLHHGCIPLLYPHERPPDMPEDSTDGDERLEWAFSLLIEQGLVEEGDYVVLAHGWKSGIQSLTTYRLAMVGSDLVGESYVRT